MTIPRRPTAAHLFETCVVCGHGEAEVLDATTAICLGRVYEPDTGHWRRCGYEHHTA